DRSARPHLVRGGTAAGAAETVGAGGGGGRRAPAPAIEQHRNNLFSPAGWNRRCTLSRSSRNSSLHVSVRKWATCCSHVRLFLSPSTRRDGCINSPIDSPALELSLARNR